MIPSRKILVVTLAVLGAAALAMAAGVSGGGDGMPAADVALQEAGEARDAGEDQEAGDAQDADDAEEAGDAQEVGEAEEVGAARPDAPARPLLPVRDYEPSGLTAEEAIEAHVNAEEGPEQPIPFNHRFHVRDVGMQCAYCHGGVQSSPIAPVPAVDVCMGCHRVVGSGLDPIEELRELSGEGETVAWERVYKVPDFVQFPHDAHVRNDLPCAECHGPVEDMDRVYPVTDLRMGWCLECHMGEGAESDYATDRLLARDFPPPQPPGDRQPVGLYPRTIDQRYAATRGPIDCTACHF